VTDIRFTNQRVAAPDVTVLVDTRRTTGPDGFLLEDCTGLDIDRFNRNKGEEVVVNLIVLNNGATDPDGAIQVIAHEVGHAFGLRHVRSPMDPGPSPVGIMRPGGSDRYPVCVRNCRFLNEINSLSEPETQILLLPNPSVSTSFFYTSNPVFHLRRYVEREPRSTIVASGTCPGTWDETLAVRRRIVTFKPGSQPSTTAKSDSASTTADPVPTLFNAKINEWYGNDIPRQLGFQSELTLDDLYAQRWTIPESSFLELVASSDPNAVADVVLGVIEDGSLKRGLDPTIEGQELSLLRINGTDTFEVVANVVATSQPAEMFSDGYEGAASVARDSTAATTATSTIGTPLQSHRGVNELQERFGQPLEIEDFDAYTSGQRLSSLFDGLVTFSGWSENPSVFFGAWSLFGPGGGPIEGGALLPQPSTDPSKPPFTFNFEQPVLAFGADFYDDGPEPNVITLRATTVSGETREITDVSSQSGWVGFMGFTSDVGITSVTMFNGVPDAGPIEIDNIRLLRGCPTP
jgi:hypothetical protein